MIKRLLGHKAILCMAVVAVVIAAVAITAVLVYNSSSAQQIRNPLEYTDEVSYWAEEYDVDPYLVYAVIQTESSFQPTAESSAGARGLMQMTEDTFDWVKSKIAPEETLVFDDLYTPDISIRFGVYFISMCLERYGEDVSTAAAAYHSGWGTVDGLLSDSTYTQDGTVLHSFPYQQMSHYVYKINEAYTSYIETYTEIN